MGKASGESPLLQQGELDFSPAEKQSILKWALALGFSPPALKRVIKADLFRSAEALLPPHKCGGSHREGHSRIYLMPSGYGLGVEVPAPVLSLDLASDAGEGELLLEAAGFFFLCTVFVDDCVSSTTTFLGGAAAAA
jgi:hypothetical protein